MLDRTLTATRMGILDQVRRPLLVVMLAVVPILFITWGARATPETPRTVTLPDGQVVLTDTRTLTTVIDVPVAIAFLGGLVGVFVVNSALESDRRLVIAGFTPAEVVVPRIVVLSAALLVVAAVSLVVMAFSYTPERWLAFAGANILVGLQYTAIGALAGALLGRLGAVYFMFFLPNIDIGIAQDPLFFSGDPPGWAASLPAYGPTRILIDAFYSDTVHLGGTLAAGLAWFAGLGLAVALLLRRAVAARH